MLKTADEPLARTYDIAAFDLDGVVYVGGEAVPQAASSLAAVREQGQRVAFVTNNASRPPEAVAEQLERLGVSAAVDDVVTSAQAAAAVLADRFPAGSAVYLIGGAGLDQALREQGLVPVTSADDDPVAVVQGYGPGMPWRQVVAGAVLVRAGLPWVATNTDMTIPTAQGVGPGNGTLVALVADFAGREAEVAGKPSPPLLEQTLSRVGGSTPLFVGDRLDTDILGAHNVGWDSLLVLTGVTGLVELVAAPPDQRPSYVSTDLRGLLEPHPAPSVEGDRVVLGGWTGHLDDPTLRIDGDGSSADWWRVAATTGWAVLDRTGEPADVSAVRPPDDDPPVA